MTDQVSAPGRQAPANPPPLMQSGQPAFGRNSGRKNDIVTRRNRWPARIFRFLRMMALPVLALVLVVYAFLDPFVMGSIMVVGRVVGQLLFAILFMVVQFGALFWFVSRSRVEVIKPEDPKATTFDEYWGQPTLLKLVKQWLSLLSDRDRFVEMGGKYINGILLYGPPGTGKTMLAKAMAGETGVPFISIEGAGFRGMFIGVDVMKMMSFCGKAKRLAKEYGACIAYIDEIDAVGQSRGNVMGGGGGGMGMGMGMGGMMGGGSGALTRLLYEMDGVDEKGRIEKLRDRFYKLAGKKPPVRNWHVLYMGSTNRPDVLDAALLRPGRFDQKIEVGTPDKSGRREVVNGYLRKVRHDTTVNVEAIVEDTPHATPAQIAAALTKDAVRIALFKGRAAVAQQDIDQALQEQYMGIEHPIEEWEYEQRLQVAYHEAGHAVVQHYLMPDQRIVRLTIVRRGGALGYMMPVDSVEVYAEPLRRMAADIMVSMAGHVATKLHMGEYWDGAWSDFSKVRHQIWRLYSLGYFGPPVRGTENSRDGGGVPASAEPLVERFWRTLEEQTETLLAKHADEMEALTTALMEKSDLSHDEVMALLGDNGYKGRPQTRLSGRSTKGLPAPALAPVAVAADRPVSDTQPNPAVKRPQPANGQDGERQPVSDH